MDGKRRELAHEINLEIGRLTPVMAKSEWGKKCMSVHKYISQTQVSQNAASGAYCVESELLLNGLHRNLANGHVRSQICPALKCACIRSSA